MHNGVPTMEWEILGVVAVAFLGGWAVGYASGNPFIGRRGQRS